jgi:hypothetical protein
MTFLGRCGWAFRMDERYAVSKHKDGSSWFGDEWGSTAPYSIDAHVRPSSHAACGHARPHRCSISSCQRRCHISSLSLIDHPVSTATLSLLLAFSY